jgi:HAD superfamily hydrolase (TIGR01509 family)
MTTEPPMYGVSFDLFGTLVTVERPSSPADAIAAELEARDVPVPHDWHAAYAEPHESLPEGAELSLPAHVAAAVESRTDAPLSGADRRAVEDAVAAAFDTEVRTRPGAADAVDALADRGPVGVLSNCSVPSLVERTLATADVDESAFDAVVTSVGCGWRKPDPRAFETVASELGVAVDRLVHVGDDPGADGGAADAGARSILIDDVDVGDVPTALEDRWD